MTTLQYICKDCGNLTIPQRQTRGSFLIEIVLWFFFIIPGLIYTLWRMSSKYYVCEHCGSKTIVPTNTVAGQQLLKQVKETTPDMINQHQETLKHNAKMSNIKSGAIVALLLILFIAIGVTSNRNKETTNQANLASVQQETPVSVEPLPVTELATLTQNQAKTKYESQIENYNTGSLTPSKKVKITGFDYSGGKANVQIDYNVNTGKPVYIGYSFSDNPLPEETAWQVTGFSKPTTEPETNNNAVKGRKVVYWQNSEELKPFKMIQTIYESNGKVGKIAFSFEDLETAQGSKSLYYVPTN